MKFFVYQSGEMIKEGDRIRYHGEPGKVEFLVTEKIGDPGMDWYLEKFPAGGFMITAKNFGNIFLTESDTDEDLEFVSRAHGNP